MLTFLRVCLLALMVCVPLWGQAADNTDNLPNSDVPVKVNAAVELPKMQQILDKIKQQVSGETDNSKLSALNSLALELSENADTLVQAVQPQHEQVQAQLAVLGAAPASGSGITETSDVINKRKKLESQQQDIEEQIKQAEAIKSGASNLSAQISNLRRDVLKTQLALNAGSIFSTQFWSPLFNSHNNDGDKLSDFTAELKAAVLLAFSPGWIVGTVGWILAAILIATLGRSYLERFLAWIGEHRLPEGRLRRSFLATTSALTTLGGVMLAFNFLNLAFTRHVDVTDDVHLFASKLVSLSTFCGLIAGLGRALLSTQRPSWRLPHMSSEVAMALKPYPPLAATLVFIFQSAEIFNRSANTSVGISVFANGMTALLIAVTTFSLCVSTSRARYRLLRQGQQPERRSVLDGVIHLLLTLISITIMIALVSGYITFARFLAYEVIWLGIVFSLFYIFSQLVADTCHSLFSVHSASGKRIQSLLSLDDRHLEQTATLLSALGKTLLLLTAIIALLNGTLGTSTPLELLQKTIAFWGGKGLTSMNIVPAHFVKALVALVIGLWVLRAVRRWLERDFLPKTTMTQGMRVSLITLLSNIGFVLVILMTLSIMGLEWSKLAWIVSALSVGIGFGLQEIVKNFISGLILLTERPVKVGDLVSISGIEGDIRRINVRATEIQLSDKSTVIVPNSQLIAQNVRNVTMGNAQGVATISLTFPLSVDVQNVRQLLLDIFHENESVMAEPAPYVLFKDLTSGGILLAVTGYVASPRMLSTVKSDLLFEILRRLREEGVALSSPQSVVVEHKQND